MYDMCETRETLDAVACGRKTRRLDDSVTSTKENNFSGFLNDDCWKHVLDYVSAKDIVAMGEVCQQWEGVVLRYLQDVRLRIETITNVWDGDEIQRRHKCRILVLKNDAIYLNAVLTRWGSLVSELIYDARLANEHILQNLGIDCPNLQNITFVRLKWHEPACSWAANFTTLRRVCFENCAIRDNCVTELIKNNHIEELVFRMTETLTGAFLSDAAQNGGDLTTLKTLILSRCPDLLFRKVRSAVEPVNYLTGIRKLELRDVNDIVHTQADRILDKMPQLEHLTFDCRRCFVRGSILKSVTKLRCLQHLSWINGVVLQGQELQAALLNMDLLRRGLRVPSMELLQVDDDIDDPPARPLFPPRHHWPLQRNRRDLGPDHGRGFLERIRLLRAGQVPNRIFDPAQGLAVVDPPLILDRHLRINLGPPLNPALIDPVLPLNPVPQLELLPPLNPIPPLGPVPLLDPLPPLNPALQPLDPVPEAETRTIMDYLDEDCWHVLLGYLSVRDILRTECASKRWQGVMLRYLRGIRIHIHPRPDNGVLKWCIPYANVTQGKICVLKLTEDNFSSFAYWTYKLGPSVATAYCDSDKSLAFYKNCPNLSALTLTGLPTLDETLLKTQDENFKWLRSIHIRQCPLISDHCISKFMTNKALQELAVNNNMTLTGQCLLNKKSVHLKSLAFKSCHNLDKNFLLSSDLSQLRKLELTGGKREFYEDIHLLFDKMPKLEHVQIYRMRMQSNYFFKSICRLSKLKHLDVSFEATDEDLEAASRSCQELRSLQLRHCWEVTGRGVAAVCAGAGARLVALGIRCGARLTDDDAVACVRGCPNLTRLDLLGCRGLTPALLPRAAAARREMRARRPLHLRIVATPADSRPCQDQYPELVIYGRKR